MIDDGIEPTVVKYLPLAVQLYYQKDLNIA